MADQVFQKVLPESVVQEQGLASGAYTPSNGLMQLDNSGNATTTPVAASTTNVPLPSSTDLGQKATGLVDQAAGMQYEGNPYDKKVNDALAVIEGSSYESSYATDIQKIVDSLMNSKFEYDPTKDSLFQQANKLNQQQVYEDMARRGILASTVTADRVAQSTAEMMPQFEQQARNRYNDTIQEKYQLFNALNSLDQVAYGQYRDKIGDQFSLAEYYNKLSQQDYSKYLDEVDNLYKQAESYNTLNVQDLTVIGQNIDRDFDRQKIEFDKVQTDIANKRNEINDAWVRVEQLGYADKESALTLGVEPGTLSASARQAKQDMEDKLKIIGVEQANRIAILNKEYAQQKSLIDARTSKENATKVTENWSVPTDKVASNVKELEAAFARGRLSQAAIVEYINKNAKTLTDKYGSEALSIIQNKYSGGTQAPTQESFNQVYSALFSPESNLGGDGESILNEVSSNWDKYSSALGEDGAMQLLEEADKLAQQQAPDKALQSAISFIGSKSELEKAKYVEANKAKLQKSLGSNFNVFLEEIGLSGMFDK